MRKVLEKKFDINMDLMDLFKEWISFFWGLSKCKLH